MKKQIITLSMCFALTATAALAQSATTVPVTETCKIKQEATIPVSVPCKVKPEKPCEPGKMMPTEAEKKQFEAKMIKEKELFHSALNLTPEQKAKADALDKKARTEAKPLMDKVREEKTKLNDLVAKKAPEEEILKQKMAYKTAKKELKKHFKASRKAFEAILTKDQLAKLKIIKEQRKTEMKNCKKCECGKCGVNCKCNKCDKCKKHPGKGHGPMGIDGPDEGPGGHHTLPLSGADDKKGAAIPKCSCGK